jgi:hypothetical protein
VRSQRSVLNFEEGLAEGKCRRALNTLLSMSPVSPLPDAKALGATRCGANGNNRLCEVGASSTNGS